MEEKPKLRLSLSKLLNFLDKYSYLLSTVYCENFDQIRFLECRSPVQQKTFFIHIPSKYIMEADESVKRIHIERTGEADTGVRTRQFKYISDIKGPLLDCDLISISSSNICVYKNSGEAIFYEHINPDEKKKEEEEEEEEDEISGLEKQTEKVLDKFGKKLPKPELRKRKKKVRFEEKKENSDEEETMKEIDESETKENPEEEKDEPETKEETEEKPKEKEPEAKEEAEEKTEKELEEEPEEEKVELIFEDTEGESIEDVKEFISVDKESLGTKKSKDLTKDLETMKRKINIDSEISEHFTTHDNTPPPDLENEDIILGIVYFLIDIGPFYSKIQDFEKKIIKVYEQIDDNILDVRKTKFREIKEITTNFLNHGEERLNKINEKEKTLRESLIRLTIILSQTEELKTKIKDNPKKYKEEIVNIDKIYNQTRKTIYELNMDLLRLQDSADELLSNYKESIEELLEL